MDVESKSETPTMEKRWEVCALDLGEKFLSYVYSPSGQLYCFGTNTRLVNNTRIVEHRRTKRIAYYSRAVQLRLSELAQHEADKTNVEEVADLSSREMLSIEKMNANNALKKTRVLYNKVKANFLQEDKEEKDDETEEADMEERERGVNEEKGVKKDKSFAEIKADLKKKKREKKVKNYKNRKDKCLLSGTEYKKNRTIEQVANKTRWVGKSDEEIKEMKRKRTKNNESNRIRVYRKAEVKTKNLIRDFHYKVLFYNIILLTIIYNNKY